MLHTKLKAVRLIRIVLASLIVFIMAACSHKQPEPPVTLTVWHYYNGVQQQTFSDLVDEFNETVGVSENIYIEAFGKGSIVDLRNAVFAAAEKKVDAESLPNLFLSYSDSAYQLYKQGQLADLSPYFTEQEKSRYLDAYLAEGAFARDDGLFLFPIAKSTEILMVNMTDFAPFAQTCQISEQDLTTWEGIATVAQKYYAYTDALTDTPNDGRAFFGRDALANYLLIGSQQLGEPIFKIHNNAVTLNVSPTAMRRLWNNYYVPYISGYFAAVGRFRSDDAKTGEIIALVGATSGASYFPGAVTRPDGSSYPIEAKVFPLPNFSGCGGYAVQQGASMAMIKADARTEHAAATFLKWFTEPAQNLRFCGSTGYLPVQKASSNIALFNRYIAEGNINITPIVKSTLETGIKMSNSYHIYSNPAFDNGYAYRLVVENALKSQAEHDLAEVNSAISTGMDRQTALAPFLTDAHFDAWLARFELELKQVSVS